MRLRLNHLLAALSLLLSALPASAQTVNTYLLAAANPASAGQGSSATSISINYTTRSRLAPSALCFYPGFNTTPITPTTATRAEATWLVLFPLKRLLPSTPFN